MPLQVDQSGEYLKTLLATDFTEQQMAVIRADLTPQLVIAGAGSGKTMVMAARVVHAVAHHRIAPSQILGLTFTNKAAGELAERVRKCLDRLRAAGMLMSPADLDDETAAYDDLPTVATYHSYAAHIVRDHALRIGREPGATLLTEAVRWQLAMRVASRASGPFRHLNWTTPYVADLIVALAGDMAEHLATADDIRDHDRRVRAAIDAAPKRLSDAQKIYDKTLSRDELLGLVATYAAEKRRLDVIDFGDQVALACEIVAASPDVAEIERRRFAVVVLDEYQDTGVAQRTLLSHLFGDRHAVTSVGDPNQAIYGWRGASVSNLIRFADHFDAVRSDRDYLPLLTSFRCDGKILAAANAIVAPLAASAANRGRRHLELEELGPRKGAEEAGQVLLARHVTAMDEAAALAERIKAAITGGTPPGEIAVLARRRLDFPRLHHAMVERDIPVEVVGLGGLLAMPEVSDIVAVLSLLSDATANTAAVRLLTGPRWRLGVRDLAALGARAAYLAKERPVDPATGEETDDETASARESEGGDELPVGEGLDHVLNEATASVDPVEVPSLLEAAESPGRASRCSPEALERLAAFVAEIRRLRALVGQPIVDLIAEVITTTGLDVEIEAADQALAVARVANVHAFLDVAAAFTGLDGEADLSAFLAYLRAAADNEDGLDIAAVSDADTVKLMTVHAAKGLEWDVVAVPGLVDKVFPSDRGRSSWTTGAHVLPFDCRGDKEDLPVLAGFTTTEMKAFRDDCRADADDEERRLAYVAMTRARHQLWLSAYVWSPSRQDPVAVSPYVAEVHALGDAVVTVESWCEDADPDAVNPLTAEGIADVPWPALPDRAEQDSRRAAAAMVSAARDQLGLEAVLTRGAKETADQWQRDAALIIEEARRRRVRTVDVAVPARLTTSQIVALAKDEDAFAAALARPMPSRPQPQARRGSRFHQWVEQLYGASPLLEPDDLPGAEDDDLSDAELASLQERFLADGWGERRPVKVEAPFEMVVGTRLIRGRIDAIYPDGDGRYDVIDYKTGAVPTGREFEAASLQLSIYRLAWADLAGVEPDAVDAGFLYVRTGDLKRPDRLLSREELHAVLEGSVDGVQPMS
jgi:DNA helicase-2/ATP-dependent DNA helicase PcrA